MSRVKTEKGAERQLRWNLTQDHPDYGYLDTSQRSHINAANFHSIRISNKKQGKDHVSHNWQQAYEKLQTNVKRTVKRFSNKTNKLIWNSSTSKKIKANLKVLERTLKTWS